MASVRENNDQFGGSVGLSGDHAIIGARFESEDAAEGNTLAGSGSAYIFQNNAGTWSQVQKIVASDRAADDWFGRIVAISGDHAIVGVPQDDKDATGGNIQNNTGSAYIYKNNAGTWSQIHKIVASDRTPNNEFGQAIAISGDYAIVAAPYNSTNASGGSIVTFAGAAYILKNNGGTWSVVQKIVSSDRRTFDIFGSSVGISGDYLITGAWDEDEDVSGGNTVTAAGSAYIFKYCAPTSGTDLQTACRSYTWPLNNTTYTSSTNVPTFNIVGGSINGCDSLVTLNLTINNVSNLTTTTSGVDISANNANATYRWINCVSGVIDGETGQTFTATANGSYAVELTENGCVDTSDCVDILTVGILENSFGDKLSVYPNPTNGNFTIYLGAIYEKAQLLITDISGKLIESKTIAQSQVLNLSIDEPAGIYFVSVQADNKKAVIRMVKE